MKFLILLFFPIFLVGYTKCEPSHNADNVCNRPIAVRKEKLVDEPIKYEIKYNTMCGLLPCVKTRTEVRMDRRIKTSIEAVDEYTCCPGYAETPDRKCDPICLKSCKNGKCIKPNICKCDPEPSDNSPGYVGSTCNRFVCLQHNRWGSECDRECDCPQFAYCNGRTGKCLCRPGWRGVNCTEECTPSMNCEGVELPPIFESEANVIDVDLVGSSQKLVASQPRSIAEDLENEESQATRSVASLVAAHMGINLLLTILSFMLMFAVYIYRKRLNEIRNELYYTYAPSSTNPSNGSDSNYSTNSEKEYFPKFPISGPGITFKEFVARETARAENFASATRNILSKDTVDKDQQSRAKCLLDPRVESHLICSQKSSQQNIYSDVESSNDRSSNNRRHVDNLSSMRSRPENQILNISVNNQDDHVYQVPRSPVTMINQEESNRTSTLIDSDYMYPSNENIYEEIKPKSPNSNDSMQ